MITKYLIRIKRINPREHAITVVFDIETDSHGRKRAAAEIVTADDITDAEVSKHLANVSAQLLAGVDVNPPNAVRETGVAVGRAGHGPTPYGECQCYRADCDWSGPGLVEFSGDALDRVGKMKHGDGEFANGVRVSGGGEGIVMHGPSSSYPGACMCYRADCEVPR